VQVKGLLSVMGQQMITNPNADGQRFGDRSYAIISDKYLNFSSRVGYHYGVLDCYCGRTESKNYITFSFKGGAADDLKRARRARAIGLILEGLGFSVEVVGDRVVGRLHKRDTGETLEKLWLMGKLLQFTRQTDMLMVDEKSVRAMADCFLSGRYVLDGSCPLDEEAAKANGRGRGQRQAPPVPRLRRHRTDWTSGNGAGSGGALQGLEEPGCDLVRLDGREAFAAALAGGRAVQGAGAAGQRLFEHGVEAPAGVEAPGL
jgi:hypothetical protein